CSQLLVEWLNPLFKIGHKRKLEPDDMYSVLPEDRSQRLGEELQGYWDQEVKRVQKDAQEPSLMKAIVKCYWKSYLIWGVFTFLEEGTRVVQPIFLGKMISYVENYDPNDSVALHEAYGYAAGLSACVLVWAVLHHLYFYHIQRVGMRLRVAMCHMIYRKALRLSSSAMGKTTTGQIVNLLSNDVSRFDQVMMFLHYLWVGPLQAIAVTALLWMEIGMSCLAGMAVLIILLLLQICVGKLFSSLRSKTAALTDDRIRTMSEVITGIRTIKMNVWEKSFIDLITELRRKEISKILRSSYLRGMNLASFFAVSKIMIFVTFISNVVLDNMITASQVFVVVTLFEALRCSSTLYFPMAVEKVSEVIVSIQRIKKFLLLDEMSQYYPQLPSDGKMIVDVQAFTASWEKASATPTLQGLSFTVRPGQLLAVVGPVGAGKSSLLSALLGELPPSQGKVTIHGRIAYVSQQPWVYPGTVKSNILFGKKYKEDRYEEVIRACALEEDLQHLKEGDLTEVGERGTPLSEGQKARVSLARAVYQDADIYLLDDPLSSVDAIVSRHLFEQCIHQALKEKIIILVTHQLQYLKDASQILILKDGKMVERGIYSEFLKPGVDIFSLFEKGNEQSEPSAVPGTPTVISESLVQSLQSSRPSLQDAAPEDQDSETIQVTLPLEDHLEGKVGFKTYKNYFTAGANWSVIIFLILVNIAAQVTYTLQDWWLAYWANLQSDLYSGALVKEDEAVVFVLNWYLGVYSGLTVSTVLFGITRSLLIFYILVNSSQTLHNKMLETILRAPVLFFHRNLIDHLPGTSLQKTGCMFLSFIGHPFLGPQSSDIVLYRFIQQFSRSVVSNSLRPHGLQRARLPFLSQLFKHMFFSLGTMRSTGCSKLTTWKWPQSKISQNVRFCEPSGGKNYREVIIIQIGMTIRINLGILQLFVYQFSSWIVSDSFVVPWTVACQAPLSMGFPRKEYWTQGLGTWASVVVVHRLSCSAACGIFPDQGLNTCPLHWGPCTTREVPKYIFFKIIVLILVLPLPSRCLAWIPFTVSAFHNIDIITSHGKICSLWARLPLLPVRIKLQLEGRGLFLQRCLICHVLTVIQVVKSPKMDNIAKREGSILGAKIRRSEETFLSLTISWSLPKFMSIELVMPSAISFSAALFSFCL
ncbi:hypothetical protein FD754_022828, partial [Muntiacus muntjak]